jgi:SPP1 family predicted phage head-tail adaptor
MKHWFTQEASLLRRTTSTGWGSETAWSTSASVAPIMCRVNPVSGMERYAADKQTVFATHKLYCRATEAIDVDNRIAFAGDIYGVVFVKNTLGLDHHLTVYLKEPV